MDKPPIIAVTLGDPNGIGPEVVLKSLSAFAGQDVIRPVLVGSAAVLQQHVEALDLTEVQGASEIDPADSTAGRPTVVDVGDGGSPEVSFGAVTERAGRLAMRAVERAVDMCLEGTADAIVTAPISKEAVRLAGYDIPGHTEFIASRTQASSHAMMMVADQLRVGLVTTHQPVREVASLISETAVIDKLSVIRESLKTDFGIQQPAIAVLGLNPHAGDGGMIGREEIDVIVPALERVQASAGSVSGPFPADGFFGRKRYEQFDAVLAMYHDQGLVPFKTLFSNSGVNYTAGLPIVRTSPDHGTAFDIAGKGVASPESMMRAIQLGADISKRREG